MGGVRLEMSDRRPRKAARANLEDIDDKSSRWYTIRRHTGDAVNRQRMLQGYLNAAWEARYVIRYECLGYTKKDVGTWNGGKGIPAGALEHFKRIDEVHKGSMLPHTSVVASVSAANKAEQDRILSAAAAKTKRPTHAAEERKYDASDDDEDAEAGFENEDDIFEAREEEAAEDEAVAEGIDLEELEENAAVGPAPGPAVDAYEPAKVAEILAGYDKPEAKWTDPMYVGDMSVGENRLLRPLRWWMLYDGRQKRTRQKSPTHMKLVEKWSNVQNDDEYANYTCMTDTECAKKMFIFNADVITKEMLEQLRVLVLFFFYDPRKSSSSTWMVDLNAKIEQFWLKVPVLRGNENRMQKINELTTVLYRTVFTADYQATQQSNNQMSRSRNQFIVDYADISFKVHKLFVPFHNTKGDLAKLLKYGKRAVWELVVGIICCIGCRFNEVFDENVLFQEAEQSHREPNRWILQVGVSKDKNARKTGFTVPDIANAPTRDGKRSVEKPICFDMTTELIIRCIMLVRQHARNVMAERMPNSSYQAIGKKKFGIFNPKVNTAVKLTFPVQAAVAKTKGAGRADKRGQFGSHWCRALYANVAYMTYKDAMPYLNQAAFIASVLAHSADNLTTSINYSIINVRVPTNQDADPSNVLVLAGVRSRMSLLEEKLEQLLRDEKAAEKLRETVEIRNKDTNELMLLPRLPKHGRINGSSDRYNYVEEGILYLLRKGATASRNNLVKIGVSGGWVTAYRQQKKRRLIDLPDGVLAPPGVFEAQDDMVRPAKVYEKEERERIDGLLALGDAQSGIQESKAALFKFGDANPDKVRGLSMDEIVEASKKQDEKAKKEGLVMQWVPDKTNAFRGRVVYIPEGSKAASSSSSSASSSDVPEIKMEPAEELDKDGPEKEAEKGPGFFDQLVKEKEMPKPPAPPKKGYTMIYKRDHEGKKTQFEEVKLRDQAPSKLSSLLKSDGKGGKLQRVIEPTGDKSAAKMARQRDRYRFDGWTATETECREKENKEVTQEMLIREKKADGKWSAGIKRKLCQPEGMAAEDEDGFITKASSVKKPRKVN